MATKEPSARGTKKMINAVEDVVEEMVQGIVASHPSLVRIRGYHILVRADYAHVRDTQVALISGGGSGHEPAHAGFVGAGMLSAAVCGGVFASPSVGNILTANGTVTGARMPVDREKLPGDR